MAKPLHTIFLGILLLLAGFSAQAQDPQFSQFYANPLYLNPGMAGNVESGRVGANFRHQWPGIDATFTTFSAYADLFFPDVNSGVGIMAMRDQQGLAGLNSTSLNGYYAYELHLSRKLTLRPGITLGVIQRAINKDKLRFADQFTGTGFLGNTSEDLSSLNPIYQFDLGLGGFLYSPTWFVGISGAHLNEPGFTFYGSDESSASLPMRLTAVAGYKIYLMADALRSGYDRFGRERSITPVAEYRMQGQFKQLSVGSYFTYEPLVLGLWYRGLPIGGIEEVDNKNESAIALVGLKRGSLSLGYSFDYTLSSLGMATGGAHEVSVSYQFKATDSKKPPRSTRIIPCPEF